VVPKLPVTAQEAYGIDCKPSVTQEEEANAEKNKNICVYTIRVCLDALTLYTHCCVSVLYVQQ
jgi:hypothetical protein